MDRKRKAKLQQQKLGVSLLPRACTKSPYTEDELSALFYFMREQPVPNELIERILCTKKWELPLYELLFDVEVIEGVTEFGEATGTKFRRLVPGKIRSYLKMIGEKIGRLNQIQGQFLNSWGLSWEDSKNVSDEIFMKMKEQIVSFQGYITLDMVERFISKESEKKEMISERELEPNFKLAVEIFDKLMDANIVKRYEDLKEELEESTCHLVYSEFLNQFKFLPVENLKKIVAMEYKPNSTVAQWFQELQKQELLKFVPYLCEKEDKNILIVLDYNEYMIWKAYSGEFTVSFKDMNCEQYSVNNEMSANLQKYIKIILQNHIGENVGDTKLLQILFYMRFVNWGAHSRTFQDKLFQDTELLNELVAILGKHTVDFKQYEFKFDDFITFMKKEERTFQDLIEVDKVDAFRVPAYDANFDLCRIAIYNSLNIVMEHTSENGGSKRMKFNLEPLLEQMDWLTEEEKQFLLTSKAVRNTIILFLLNIRGVAVTQANVYPRKEFFNLPKLNIELPVICGLNDLTE